MSRERQSFFRFQKSHKTITSKRVSDHSRKWRTLGLTMVVVLVAVFLGGLMRVEPVSAITWNPTLGWDFECHSHTHPSLIELTENQIRSELEQVNTAFAAHGYAPPQHHAYPYGDYDSSVEKIVSQYRKTGRTVWGEMTTYPVTDWYEMMAAQLVRTTSWSEIRAWVDSCIASKALLHIFTHDVSSNPSEWGCTPTILVQMLDYLVQKQNAGQLAVMTTAQAYDYWSSTASGRATVVVSFDDSYESDYTVVYPLFKARGLKGTSYIITRVIGESGSLTWDEISKMRASPTIFQNGFESGGFSTWTGTTASSGETAAVTTTRSHHDSYSARFGSNGGGGTEYAYCYKTVSSSSELYARGYFYVSQSGVVDESDRFYFVIFRAGNSDVAYAGWKKTGGIVKWCLTMRNGTSSIDIFSSTSPVLNRWYCVELHWKKDAVNGQAEVWVDGVRVCASTGKNTAAYGDANAVRFGLADIYNCANTTVYCDCTKIAVTYIGPEPIVNSFTVSPNPFSPNGDGTNDTTAIKATFNVAVNWKLQAKTSSGVVSRSWKGTGSSLSLIWDGKDGSGSKVPDGTYSLALTGIDQTGSQLTPKTVQVSVDTKLPTVTGVSVSPSSFNPRTGQTAKIGYTLSESYYVTINVYNSAGTLVRTLVKNALQSSGARSVTWNGKTSSGTIVPSGIYTIKISVADKAGNKATTYPITKTVTVT